MSGKATFLTSVQNIFMFWKRRADIGKIDEVILFYFLKDTEGFVVFVELQWMWEPII